VKHKISRVEYYHAIVKDRPGEAYKFLTKLAGMGINLLSFTAVPLKPRSTQLTIFPEDPAKLKREAKKNNMVLDGPHKAFWVQGDDELGALADIHRKIYEADVNVYSASGVIDGQGSYGYIVYVEAKDYEAAAKALDI
jgi:predicted amino acid-binding ACT domain protein